MPVPPFAQRLIRWQRAHGRHDLPWQNTRDPYRLWLSEIMLQQTQVATVIAYYERFVAAFPDIASLAAAPVDRVLELWSGLGYYRRAHHLHDAAKRVMAEHGGHFPREIDAIASLPGIGKLTAHAIAAFAYDQRVPILDGNVKRVLARHRGIEGYPGVPQVAAQLWECAEALLPSSDLVAYTQGMMDLGATVCTRANPRCDECPVRIDCVARTTNRIHMLPSPRPSRTVPQRAVQVLVIARAGEILFEKRPATGIWGGLWSLPQIACDEDAVAFCRQRFGANVVDEGEYPVIEHAFTHYRLTMLPRSMAVKRWAMRVEEPGFIWLTPEDAGGAALPAPIKKFVRALSGEAPRTRRLPFE